MRGKPIARKIAEKIGRITPAHAGKTAAPQSYQHRREDHPRACGENLRSEKTESRKVGSPPRMRGKPPAQPHRSRPSRITPAHAGKTSADEVIIPACGDHPRACGENVLVRRDGRSDRGSPPRMRGKHVLPLSGDKRAGITPAHAGKTYIKKYKIKLIEDHPRACGENPHGNGVNVWAGGSPPRMRGKQCS